MLLIVASMLNGTLAGEFNLRVVRVGTPEEHTRLYDTANVNVGGHVYWPGEIDVKKVQARLRLIRSTGNRLLMVEEATVELQPLPNDPGVYTFSFNFHPKKPRPSGDYVVRVDIVDTTDEKRPSLARDSVFIFVVDGKPKTDLKVSGGARPPLPKLPDEPFRVAAKS